jgi:hypothetical protein
MLDNMIVPACEKLSGKLASPPFCSCKPGTCKLELKLTGREDT